MATIKQEKLIRLLMENYGKKGRTRALGSILLEAGYSPASAKNPKLILDSEEIVEGLKDFISTLDDKRRLAITHITDDKLKAAKPTDLAYIIDVFTKNHQLLSGKETARTGFNLTDEEKDEIDNIFKDNEHSPKAH